MTKQQTFEDRLYTSVEYKNDHVAIVKTELKSEGHYADVSYKQIIVHTNKSTRRTTIYDSEDEFSVEQTEDNFCNTLDEAIQDAKETQEDALKELFADEEV